jgi:hypothetical protein
MKQQRLAVQAGQHVPLALGMHCVVLQPRHRKQFQSVGEMHTRCVHADFINPITVLRSLELSRGSLGAHCCTPIIC